MLKRNPLQCQQEKQQSKYMLYISKWDDKNSFQKYKYIIQEHVRLPEIWDNQTIAQKRDEFLMFWIVDWNMSICIETCIYIYIYGFIYRYRFFYIDTNTDTTFRYRYQSIHIAIHITILSRVRLFCTEKWRTAIKRTTHSLLQLLVQ